jgi:hypothetical protein
MSYRPYPNRERALAQVYRHAPSAPVVELECLRPVGEAFERLRAHTQRALRAASEPGTYVLSTRPSVVGGGS